VLQDVAKPINVTDQYMMSQQEYLQCEGFSKRSAHQNANYSEEESEDCYSANSKGINERVCRL
jgi:hypothetical protein